MAPVKIVQVKWHRKNDLRVGGWGLRKFNISGSFLPTFPIVPLLLVPLLPVPLLPVPFLSKIFFLYV